MKAILSQFREIDPDMPFWVMTRRKNETRVANKTRAMYIFNVVAFIRSLRKAEIFVNGGGSLMQDVTSSRSLYFYLFTLKAAKWCGCKIIMYGCGIGPINLPRNRRIAAKVLNSTADIITLRDRVSLELLKEMKVDKPEIILAADPTVNIQKANPAVVEAAFAQEGVPAGIRMIGFCLRNWPDFRHPEWIGEAADYAWKTYGLTPVFLPIEIPKDISAAAKATAGMTSPYYTCSQKHTVEELIGMLGSMEVVVGMRLHSLIFATAGGAPVIGISYDVKVDSFIKYIGSDSCISLTSLSKEWLCKEIDLAVQRGPEKVQEAVARLREAQKINIDAARRLLNRPEERRA